DREHQSTDWRGIHERICPMVVPLRTPVAVLGSEEERAHRETQTRRRQVQLLELTKTEAHKKLYEGEYDLAIPAALQALRFSIQVHGANSARLVPAYLLLGESSIGLAQLSQAEDYLSLAKWALMNKREADKVAEKGSPLHHQKQDRQQDELDEVQPGDDPAALLQAPEHCTVRALLHRNFGLLYRAKRMWTEAADSFALDIYYSSLVHNDPEDLSVTGGYYHLGTVLQAQAHHDDAQALFVRVVDIWAAALRSAEDPGGSAADAAMQLDEAQQAEGVQILSGIAGTVFPPNVVEKSVLAGPLGARANGALAVLMFREGSVQRAKRAAETALQLYEAAECREIPAATILASWMTTLV
ncbi:Zinc finger MYND domain-containing protein 12, partial [Thoreauomyces humboldtii]